MNCGRSPRDGFSVVTVGFSLEKDGNVGGQEVRERVDGATFQLPRGIEPPVVEKIVADATPVIAVILSGDATLRELTEFGDKVLKRNLGTVAGVGPGQHHRRTGASGPGHRERGRPCEPGTSRGPGGSGAIQSQNLQLPGGKVEQGARDLSLRTYGRVRVDRPVRRDRGGRRRTASRCGSRTWRGSRTARRIPSRPRCGTASPRSPCWSGSSRGPTPSTTVDAVRERVESLRARLPKGWRIDYARDQSEFVKTSIAAVQEHLVLGSILAAVVVWMFLKRSRPTLIAALSIPASIISAFAAIKYMGYTLNTITLLALTLVVGIVIDDAVIVIENIFRLLEDKRLPPRQAAIEGTREIGLAVLATTLSLIAVFLPIGFMGGIVGRFMGSFGITMSFAIFISLIVAFTHHAHAVRPLAARSQGGRRGGPRSRSQRTRSRDLRGGRSGLHGRCSAGPWAIASPCWRSSRLTVLLQHAPRRHGQQELPAHRRRGPVRDPGAGARRLVARVRPGRSWSRSRKQVRALEGVEATLTTIGADQLRTQNFGSIYVKMKGLEERATSVFDVQAQGA